MVVETTRDTEGIPTPAITIAVTNQIKNGSCFDKNASNNVFEQCFERNTLNGSEMFGRVIMGWKLKKKST